MNNWTICNTYIAQNCVDMQIMNKTKFTRHIDMIKIWTIAPEM